MSNKWYSNPWIFLWRLKNKLETEFRQHVFKAYTANRNKDIHIYGKMHLINPNVRCGNNVSFYSDVLLFGDGLIEIGDNVDIGQGTIIYASANRGGVKIGSNTMIAGHCYIIDMDHGFKRNEFIRNQHNIVEPIIIGEDVWIASDVAVLRGSIIKNGAVIGAKALVKGRIPENSIAVGIPAKVIKERK